MSETLRPDNPHAFPVPPDAYINHEGMTLRDYFAGAALAGMASQMNEFPYPTVARRCYVLADAMLAAREGA